MPKITYDNKVGLIPKNIHVNEWWDDDANEIKTKHNANDDRITALEALTTNFLWSSIQSIGDLTDVGTPQGTDLLVIESGGVKKRISYSAFSGGVASNHSTLSNLDYASAGHTGFQQELTEGTGINISGSSISVDTSEIDHNSLLNYDPNRHKLQEELEITTSQISDIDSVQSVFGFEIAAGASVQDRINASAPNPYGWTLIGNGLDLEIEHNLNRRVMDVKIWANDSGEEQQLRGTVSDNGLVTPDANNLTIKSLSKVDKPLKIYISFL